MIISMTGYGYYECENDKISFSIELKSINSKYFESNIKLPYLFSNQERGISDLLKKELIRGRVNFNLNYKMKESKHTMYALDEVKLNSYLKILNDIKNKAKIEESISLANILNFQDIISMDKKMNDQSIIKLLYKGLKETIKEHKTFRKKEGKFIQNDILKSIATIAKSMKKIDLIWNNEKAIYFDKYSKRISNIIDKYNLNNDRLFQEVAIIFDKRDINEEIIRIKSHIKSFISYIKNQDILGKRLIFLIQELFRESNTIASKSEIIDINQEIIEVKTELEKIKEQVQNIL